MALGLLVMRELYERLKDALINLLDTLSNGALGLLKRLSDNLSVFFPALAMLVFLVVLLSVVFLKARAARKTKEDYAWRLRVLDLQKHVESLVSIQSLLRERVLSWNTTGYFMLGYARQGLEFFLCVKGLTKVQAEVIESFLKTLEPNIKWGRVRRAECPKFTPSNGLEELEKPVSSLLKSIGKSAWRMGSVQDLLDNEKSGDRIIAFARSKQDGRPVGIRVSELYRHVGIFGSTGSGKTTTASIIAVQAALSEQSVVVLDWHGEYRDIFAKLKAKLKREKVPEVQVLNPVRSKVSINPLDGGIEETIDVLEDVFSLTPPQAATLYKVLKESRGVRSLHQLTLLLDSSYHESYWERELRAALVRRLEAINSSEGRILFSDKQSELPLNPRTILIVDLSEIKNYTLKRLYALTLLRVLFQRGQNRGLQKTVLVLDEAHNLLPKAKENFVSRMLAESRKFGIGLILITQSPSSINVEFVKNLNTKIVHSLKTGMDIEIVEESMALDNEKASTLPLLEVGEALFSSPSNPIPIHIVVEVPYDWLR
uniref:ATP-binding protein n=1 Tax=Fervidicoccus fontis TaxID=683846 RepID=A0A7J3ZLR3_9CREN